MPPPPGSPTARAAGVLRFMQRLVGDLADGDLADAEGGLELVRGGGLADEHEVGDAGLLVGRRPEHEAA